MLSYTNGFTQKPKKNEEINRQGYVSYEVRNNYTLAAIHQKDIDSFRLKIKEYLSVEQRDKAYDSRIIALDDSLIRPSKERAVSVLQPPESYYFFNDTIKVYSLSKSFIYVPEYFKSFKKYQRKNKISKYAFELKNKYKEQNVDYKIEINKNDTKKILGLLGYKVIINAHIKTSMIDENHRYELYVSDEYNFPFMYYNFLRLRKKLNLNGLILECKWYSEDIQGCLQYVLDDYNGNKQNHKLIDIDFENYILKRY